MQRLEEGEWERRSNRGGRLSLFFRTGLRRGTMPLARRASRFLVFGFLVFFRTSCGLGRRRVIIKGVHIWARGMGNMEKIVWQGLLYDFYGELLTEHQRQVYEDVVLHDLSLSEIAKEQGITRQGVHDLVRRCDRILEEYERKLRLVEKFQATKELAGRVESLLREYGRRREESLLEQAMEAARRIAEL